MQPYTADQIRTTMNAISTITLETYLIEHIPVLAIVPLGSAPCPVVFHVCGYGRDKSDGLALGYQLAQRGIACLSFDPLYHGERYDPILERAFEPERGGLYPPETGLDVFRTFLRVIRQCALDIRTLLNAFASDPRFDVQQAGVTGHSQGGYASYLAFAEIPELRAAVPMMGLPTFTRRWQDLLDECALSNAAWEVALDRVAAQTQQTTIEIQRFDPAEKLKRAAPRALLAMCGDYDSDQPKHYVLDWYKTVRAAYAQQPDRLRLNLYPVGHVVTAQMQHDAVVWFVEHLKPDQASRTAT
jgi:dienelactone hydrolase